MYGHLHSLEYSLEFLHVLNLVADVNTGRILGILLRTKQCWTLTNIGLGVGQRGWRRLDQRAEAGVLGGLAACGQQCASKKDGCAAVIILVSPFAATHRILER